MLVQASVLHVLHGLRVVDCIDSRDVRRNTAKLGLLNLIAWLA